ncbi:nucleopolyhedrovirus P10 family protein [Actinacidiphila sp. ITFR-21]|uniref:nucleopolyhedrovirus P10 family protein n=1 Tax=Actinacidiphila sp. ITFR-21 TaxID=3075199 RepID=UPI002889E333|nr:nucleopolyhedrovirus P10 family protein [Streptomyces sp. ITFR-21]WNI19552.1 nucleopolyhedrovirus P10 family protein [Streptomyces sp. ITFR-21]
MDRLTRTVREQTALGRLLPLGGPGDTAWITESAAVLVLRRAADGLPGVRLREAGVHLVDWEVADVPAAAPVGALPHRPVRVEAAFEAAADEPLPLTAQRLRDTLWDAATAGLGLAVTAVDLRITGLLPDGPAAPAAAEVLEGVVVPDPEEGPVSARSGPAAAVGAAALAVPGVQRLSRRPTGLGPGVRVRDVPADAPTARHVQVRIAVAPGYVALAVARAVAAAVTAAAGPGAPGAVAAAVVVTAAG